MSRSLATLAVVSVAAIALAGSATPAHAFYLKSTDHAADHHLNILRFPPRNPAFRPCIDGTVTLRTGVFFHGAYAVSERHRTDPDLEEEKLTVRVPTTFTWEACRGWNFHIHDYQIRSTLRRRGVVASTILNTFSRDPLAEPGPIHVYGNGNYEWGGRIVRYEPGVTEPSR
jgi:hypothetical protein